MHAFVQGEGPYAALTFVLGSKKSQVLGRVCFVLFFLFDLQPNLD